MKTRFCPKGHDKTALGITKGRACRACNLYSSRLKYDTSPDYLRDYTFRKLYGISLRDYQAKLASQNGLCAICGNPPGRKSLSVDHDHRTGKVRDLLCTTCNTDVGRIENETFMTKAREYLARHGATNV
jgi:hypothetical protein